LSFGLRRIAIRFQLQVIADAFRSIGSTAAARHGP